MAVMFERRLLTVDEYHRMGEVGILSEKRIELIKGEIIKMTPIGKKHFACVNKLTDLLTEALRGDAIISVQNPIVLDEYSEPEPDLAVLKYRKDYYANKRATAKDTSLIIEVADTSIEYDRTIKAALYAKAKVREYWIVDLAVECVEVYTRPRMGVYKSHQVFTAGDRLTATKCDFSLEVDSILL
ncbi:MAG: Uma2 family endonuclease [Bacteroidota bacterium]